MLSFKLISTTSLSLILVAALSKDIDNRFAYSSEFLVVKEDDTYKGKGKIEIYFHDDKFESNTFLEESNYHKEDIFGEIITKGSFTKEEDSNYYLDIDEQIMNISRFERFHNYSDFPLLQNVVSSERRLPRKNPIKVLSSTEDYIVVASYRNGGQVMALKKH